MKKAYLKKIEMVSAWKEKQREISKFMGAKSNNWNEIEGNQQRGMDQHGKMEKAQKDVKTLILCT